jgi:general secretion pathway protein C
MLRDLVPMDLLLRRYFWAIELVAIAGCAVFLAGGAASAMEARIAVPALPPSKPHAPPPPRAREAIARNLFCSTCVDHPAEAPSPALGPGPTTLPLTLVAVMYAPAVKGVDWSIAVIRDRSDGAIGAFAVGGELTGATITGIGETRVYLDREGRREYLDLRAEPTLTATAPLAAPADPLTAELERGLRKTGERSYELQRSTLESLLGNLSALARYARIIPDSRDGRSTGLRFTGVRTDGPFARIGLQNGDLVTSVNGLDVTEPNRAIEAYTKLRSASHVSLGLERNGQRISNEYTIR